MADVESLPAGESSVDLDDVQPADFWEKEEVAKQLAGFDGAKPVGETMAMLVAVRLRPLWAKVPRRPSLFFLSQLSSASIPLSCRSFVSQEVEAGDYSTVRVLEGKVVVVLDPWYDADLNPNRAKEKRYAFDVVFDEDINQTEVYQQTARGLVDGVLDGYNSSVFAYGATGAGKTHTMLGSLQEPGVMVNTLHDMFGRMKEARFSDAKFKVRASSLADAACNASPFRKEIEHRRVQMHAIVGRGCSRRWRKGERIASSLLALPTPCLHLSPTLSAAMLSEISILSRSLRALIPLSPLSPHTLSPHLSLPAPLSAPLSAPLPAQVTLSYMEIYNELIKDLLQPTSVDLKLNEDPARGMVVQGITEYGADSADEILELLHRGNMHRAVEPTAANQVSSRSHAVLQITVEQSEATAHVTGNVRIGKLSMVDLAGSERASKTDNTGQRLKEGANINRSLLALGNCITALADKSRKGHVPFRDSKMTRLLKDSLGGNCRTVMIANISPSHRQFEETINTLKYANRAKNLKTQVARNVVSVSAHIAEYQRVIMELRNEVADLKHSLKSAQQGSGGDGGEATAPVAQRKQRSLDYVDNLEKQHMQQLKDAILSVMSDRKRLLGKLTEHSKALSDARAKEASKDGGSSSAADAAAQPPDSSVHAALHSAIADVRRKLQQNQQTINELVATAVQRISSTERLQLLQLLVRGKFLEVMNEEMSTELEMRRTLTTAAMAQGALPPELMNQAISTESWYAEHRAALDYHAKMAKTEMGGSLRAPSIAQLLDQNMVSPQQATATQNLGELVRPFTNHQKGLRRVSRDGLRDASRNNSFKGGHTGDDVPTPTGGAGPSSAGGSGLLSDLVSHDEGDDERHSSSAASDYRNSVGSSLPSSRGPTRTGRAPGKGPPMSSALSGLKKASAEGRRGGSRDHDRHGQSPNHSQPPTPAGGAVGGGGGIASASREGRPPSNTRNTVVTKLKLSEPPERVKRFKPPTNNAAGTPGGIRRLGQQTTTSQGGQLPAIRVVGTAGGEPPSAVQLASARAAAAARNNPRIQALGDAYGGNLPPGIRRPPGPPRVPIQRVAGAGLPPGGPRQRRASGGQAPAYREGKFLPPAAPSARLAARLQQREAAN